MIDHIIVGVSDLATSKRFYEEALAPLGYRTAVFDPDGNNIEAVCHKAE